MFGLQPPRHTSTLPRIDELDALLSNVEDRALTRKGIELQGLLFSMNSRAFKELINRADKPARVRVKVDYENLAFVKVEDWRTGKYIVVPSTDPQYTEGLSMAEHLMLVARVKRDLKKYERVTVKALFEARHEFRQTVQRLKREKKLSSKRLRALIGEEEEELPVARDDVLEVGEIDQAAEVPEKAPAAEKVSAKRRPASGLSREPATDQPMPGPVRIVGSPADDDDDDIAALMARTAKSGIVAQTIR
jgi:hypothetical protein